MQPKYLIVDMVHNGSKNCKYQDLQINEYLVLRVRGCSEGVCGLLQLQP